jgi:tRNA-splicing ligase RtcB
MCVTSAFLWNRSVNHLDPRPRQRDSLTDANPPDEEVCLDENENVWFPLHSGWRGVGNRFGTFFIELAKNDMRQWMINLPDKDLAYMPQGTEHFEDYVRAVHWAQDYALANRELMMRNLIAAVQGSGEVSAFEANVEVVSCHHNYVT